MVPELKEKIKKTRRPMKRIAILLLAGVAPYATAQINSNLLPTHDGETLINNGLIDISHSIIYEENGWHILGMDGHTFTSEGKPDGKPFKNLTMINNNRIELDIPAKPSPNGLPNYIYAIYNSGGDCTTINNGDIIVRTDPSDIHAGPHGMSVSYGSTVINNGYVEIYAENGRMCGGMGGGSYGNTIINNGQVDVACAAQLYGMRAGMNAVENNGNTLINTGDLRVRCLGNALAPNSPAANAYGMWLLGDGGYASNSGLIVVEGNDDNLATGIRFSNNSTENENYSSVVDNTGVVKVSGNGGAFELGVSNYYINAEGQALTGQMEVKVERWATSLRNFSHNLFQVGEKGVLDLSDATLMLRPDEDYKWGQAYSISQDAIVTTEGDGQVVGFDQMKIVAELPEFVDVNIEKNEAGNTTASLTVTDNPESAERMLATSVLSNLTTARSLLGYVEAEQVGRNLLGNTGWNVFATPLFGHEKVDRGMDVNLWGVLAGSEYTIDEKLRLGFHAIYARGDASRGMYAAKGKTDNGVLGFHITYNPNNHSYLRGQASAYLSGGTTRYAVEGTALEASADAGTDGAYLSMVYGYAFRLGEHNRIEAEGGLDGMHMSMNPDIDWYIGSYELARYHIEMTDSYNALYAKAAARWINEKKATDGLGYRFHVEGGLRGRLAATDLRMSFDGIQLPGNLKEDAVLGVFGAGATLLLPQGLDFSLAYRGNLGEYQQVHTGWLSVSKTF